MDIQGIEAHPTHDEVCHLQNVGKGWSLVEVDHLRDAVRLETRPDRAQCAAITDRQIRLILRYFAVDPSFPTEERCFPLV